MTVKHPWRNPLKRGLDSDFSASRPLQTSHSRHNGHDILNWMTCTPFFTDEVQKLWIIWTVARWAKVWSNSSRWDTCFFLAVRLKRTEIISLRVHCDVICDGIPFSAGNSSSQLCITHFSPRAECIWFRNAPFPKGHHMTQQKKKIQLRFGTRQAKHQPNTCVISDTSPVSPLC